LTSLGEIIKVLFNEIKAILREYVHETETALKKRLKRLLITGIIGSVLLTLVISLFGSAALFLLIGQLKYLSTFMPVWMAWDIMGITSGIIGALLLLVLFIIIRKQLRSPQLPATSKPENSVVGGSTMATKDAKIERVDVEIDEIAQRILLELESASSTDLSDARYAKMMLRLSDAHYAKGVLKKLGIVKSGAENELEKRAVIKVLLFSTWLQRLYFIIRSFLMGLISAAVTYLIIWYLGSINVVGSIIIGTFVFMFSLVATRLFDTQITQATKKLVELMASHRVIRDFIMKHF
jgi:ABC-type multidrug transport system fused ATPase/permease subunit